MTSQAQQEADRKIAAAKALGVLLDALQEVTREPLRYEGLATVKAVRMVTYEALSHYSGHTHEKRLLIYNRLSGMSLILDAQPDSPISTALFHVVVLAGSIMNTDSARWIELQDQDIAAAVARLNEAVGMTPKVAA